MSVSDESAVGNGAKLKRVMHYLTDAEWVTARFRYESGELNFKSDVAEAFKISLSSVEKRSRAEHWIKGAKLAESAVGHLRAATSTALTRKADEIAERLGSRLEEEMAPYFEREKRRHILDSVKRSKSRQRLADQIVKRSPQLTAKDAAYIAKVDDTYDVIKRRNLGMNDGTPAGGSLNLNILTNQAAVQVVAQP